MLLGRRPMALDCGDNSCEFAVNKGGMRTNGGCRCLQDLDRTTRFELRRYVATLREAAEILREFIDGTDPDDDRFVPLVGRARAALANLDAVRKGMP